MLALKSKSNTGSVWHWWQSCLLVFWLAVLVGLLFLWQALASVDSFLQYTDLTTSELTRLLHEAAVKPLPDQNGRVNLLVLGVDSDDFRTAAPLTDTMMIVSLEPASSSVWLLPLPRDLVLPGESQRINAIYPIFWQQASESARVQTGHYLSEKLGVPLMWTVVVAMNEVSEFVDLVGGVDVNVERSFVDYQYPRSGVDVRVVHDPALLYETVSFGEGLNHFDGEQALKFMRSRHAQSEEGSDFARSARQQRVLTALGVRLSSELQSQLAHFDFSLLGKLYAFYQKYYAVQVPFEDALAVAIKFFQQGRLPQVWNRRLNVDEPGSAIVENKTDFTLRVESLEALRREVRLQLDLTESES